MEQSCHALQCSALGWKSSNAIKCCSADTIPNKFLLRPMWIGRHVDCLGAAVALQVPAAIHHIYYYNTHSTNTILYCTILY